MHVAPGVFFTYTVRAADAEGLGATWEGSTLTVTVPAQWLPGWPDDDRVGFEGMQDAGDGRVLALLVEKDFACLHREPDEMDAFPNPLAANAGA